LLRDLRSAREGLSEREAARRLERFARAATPRLVFAL
jgi:hypothetical protein